MPLLARSLTLGCLIEALQTLVAIEPPRLQACPLNADCIASRQELDLVPGGDAVAIGDRLGDRDLTLARHPCHNPYSSKDIPY